MDDAKYHEAADRVNDTVEKVLDRAHQEGLIGEAVYSQWDDMRASAHFASTGVERYEGLIELRIDIAPKIEQARVDARQEQAAEASAAQQAAKSGCDKPRLADTARSSAGGEMAMTLLSSRQAAHATLLLEGSMTAAEAAERMGVRRRSASEALEGLVEKGVAQRNDSGRAFELTRYGRRALAAHSEAVRRQASR